MKEKSRIVRLKDAAEELEVDMCNLITSNRYNQFHIKTGKRRESYFDIGEFMYIDELRESLLTKCKLFVEYLYHEENISYADMGRIGIIAVQSLHNHNFGFDKALEFVTWWAMNRPFHLARFDEFYNWKPTLKNRALSYKPFKCTKGKQ